MAKTFQKGVLEAFPIVFSYLILSVPFGILATKLGIPPWASIGMSVFVFAGSAQFICLQLIAVNAGLAAIVAATFVINLRHFLMSMSLGHALPRTRKRFLLYIAHANTDETYGINITKRKPLAFANVLGTNFFSHLGWIGGTAVGAVAGSVIPIEMKYVEGILPLMFVALLGSQIRSGKDHVLTLLAGALTLAFLQIFPGKWPFLITALSLPTLALLWRKE